MVKVGDRVRVSGERSGDSYNGFGVIEDVGGTTFHGVRLDNGKYVAAKVENISFVTTPPQKITQNGYEYELVGPVKPDWLVDGAWVVRKDNGETHQINQQSENMFSATSSYSRVTGLTTKMVSEEFRPHTSSDWKWGDWALYDGKRVFVLSGLENASSMIAVTFPNIDSGGWGEWDKNHDFIDVSKLTPTF